MSIHRGFLVLGVIGLSIAGALANTTVTYTGPDLGKWNDPTNWSPQVVPNNSGGNSFDVLIGDREVKLNIDATVSSLTFDGQTVLTDPNLVSTDHNFTTGASAFNNVGKVLVNAATTNVLCDLGNLAEFDPATGTLSGVPLLGGEAASGLTAKIQFNGANIVENHAGLLFGGAGNVRFTDENDNDALAHFVQNATEGSITVRDGFNAVFQNSIVNGGVFQVFDGSSITFNNNYTATGSGPNANDPESGLIFAEASTGVANVVINGLLTNYDPATKTLTGGRYELHGIGNDSGAARIHVQGEPLDIVNANASILLTGTNGGVSSSILDSNGDDALRNLASFFRYRVANLNPVPSTKGSLTGSASDDALLNIAGSVLEVNGDLTMHGGTLWISVLSDPLDLSSTRGVADLFVHGDANLKSLKELRFDIFETDANDDGLQADGTVTIGGNLTLLILPGAQVPTGFGRDFIGGAKLKGEFSNAPRHGRVAAYNATGLTREGEVTGTVAGTFATRYDGTGFHVDDFQPHASMRNVSTRVDVRSDTDDAGIAGFIIRGIAPKTVLLRALGPSLRHDGIHHPLENPTLELRDANQNLIASNDGWKSTQKADIKATGMQPKRDRESAILATLEPGAYTAIVRASNGGKGVALVEAYDLDAQPAGSEFANVSTRGFVGKRENVMIGGTVIGPERAANMVIRALGPSLTKKGVANALQDPTLEVFNSSGTRIAENDNWPQSNSRDEILQDHLAPPNKRESALQINLKPGSYTAIVRGKDDTTGVALVEFYKIN